ncbi:MAG TPA: SusC/RagA family TonB-linked outer membrane protein [Gemmatimonadaceae bacterium]
MSPRLRRLLAAVTMLGVPACAWAQSAVITGTVRSTTNVPIASARVSIDELGIASETDSAGAYRLTVPADQANGQTAMLRVMRLGYQPTSQRITLAPGDHQLDLALKDAPLQLQGVVVTALGVQSKQRSLPYVAQTVSGKDIAKAPVPDVIDALAGKSAGVNITSSGGRPGAGSRIVLRGESSFLGNSQPLFVIDGVPVSNDVDHSQGSFNLNNGEMTNRGVDIDPNSIESISVLRGAAATALYGSRAANGAIIITTKRGTGRTSFSLSSHISNDTPIFGQYQDTYLGGQNGYFSNGLPLDRGGYVQPGYPGTNPVTLLSWGPNKNNVDPAVLQALGVSAIPTYDPRRDYYQTGHTLDNSLNLSGQIPTGSYFLGVSNTHQTGIQPSSLFNRTSVTGNFTTTLGSHLTSTTNVMYTLDGNNYLDDGYYGPQRWLSIAPISYDSKSPFFSDGFPKSSGADAFWLTNNQGYTSNVNRLIAGQQLRLSLPHSLTLSDRIGLDGYTDQRTYHTNLQWWRTSPSGSMWDQKVVRQNINNDLILNLNEITLRPGLTLSGLLGNNIQTAQFRSNYISGNDINIPGLYNIANFNRITASDQLTQQRLIGLYGQASFAYDNYLYLQLSARNDWSSTLPKNANSYFYPSVGGGFVFTDALGWKNNILNYGKLRASWARVGNAAPPYELTTTFRQAGYTDYPNSVDPVRFNVPFGGVNGYVLSTSLGNPTLKPELTTEKEIGLDLGFFQNRATAEVTAYDKVTRDQIFSVPSSAATGYTSILRNAGDLRNRGIEISLGGTAIQTTNFTWDLHANWSKNHSDVLSLAPGVEDIYLAGYSYPQIRIMKDQGYGVIWGFDYQRNAQGQVLVDSTGMPMPSRTLSALGNIQPKWLGNIQSSFTYRGVTLSGLVDIRHGGQILNDELWYTVPAGTAKVTENRNDMYVFPGVSAATGQPNTTPVLRDRKYWTAWATSVQVNDIEDGSYVKLREITLSYALPTRVIAPLRISSLSLYVTGHNVYIDTPFSGGDPEGNTVGPDNAGGAAFHFFNTPTTRSYVFGLRANF